MEDVIILLIVQMSVEILMKYIIQHQVKIHQQQEQYMGYIT